MVHSQFRLIYNNQITTLSTSLDESQLRISTNDRGKKSRAVNATIVCPSSHQKRAVSREALAGFLRSDSFNLVPKRIIFQINKSIQLWTNVYKLKYSHSDI